MTTRMFGPKQAYHPSCGKPCPACQVNFKAGDWTALVALGPGDNPEARELARQHRVYNAVAVEVHYACVTGEEPDGA